MKKILSDISKLTLVGNINSLAVAAVFTIWALYLDSFLNNMTLVGLFTAFLSIVTFLSYFLIIPIIEKSNKVKIYSYSLFLFIITYILFVFIKSFLFVIITAILFMVTHSLRLSSFGIIVKDKSEKEDLSKNEGFVYTFRNLSWVIGPLIAGYIASRAGIRYVFIFSAIFALIALVAFKLSGVRDNNIKKKTDKSIIKNFTGFFKDKNRTLAYLLRGGVHFWWVLIFIFIPLLMKRNNLGELEVGVFLFAVSLPLIFLEYPFAKLTGKIGFKKIFKIGFLIPMTLIFLCFFATNIYIILSLIVLASIGLSMLEPTTEAYFFDILNKKEILRFYSPFHTSAGLSKFFGKILSAIILIFLPFKFIFLLFGTVMLLMFILSFKTKNIIEVKPRKHIAVKKIR